MTNKDNAFKRACYLFQQGYRANGGYARMTIKDPLNDKTITITHNNESSEVDRLIRNLTKEEKDNANFSSVCKLRKIV